jgi:hypothetical protein
VIKMFKKDLVGLNFFERIALKKTIKKVLKNA